MPGRRTIRRGLWRPGVAQRRFRSIGRWADESCRDPGRFGIIGPRPDATGPKGNAPHRGFFGRSGRGFTLIEILLALALAAVVLVSVNMFVFSMGELWGRGGDDRLFDRHVNGVTRFLQNNIHHATAEMRTGDEGGGEAQGEAQAAGELAATYLSRFPSEGDFGDPYITFELLESPGIFRWPERPLPFVVCYLEVASDEGLSLYWHSRLEEDFENDPPRKTLLSPFAREMVYEYFDPETEVWSERNDFDRDDQGDELLPDRIRIRFATERMETERVITLSGRRHGAFTAAIQ